jgi:CPA2 family monovalent cation:H+ antiporter-2
MLLAESPFAHQIRADVAPFRIAFVTLFFASLGLLADLRWLADPMHLLWVVLLVFMIMIGKAIIVWAVSRPLGTPNRAGLAAGLALGQIGEFSFVLAAIAQGNGLFDKAGNMFQLVVNATLMTLLLTPIVASRSFEVAGRIEELLVRWRWWKAPVVAAGVRPQHQLGHVIVIGYGPSGQAVVKALHESDFDVVVLDLNPRLITAAKANELEAHLADASRRETLEELGLDRARACVITIPHHETAISVITQLRLLSPRLPVVVRARYQSFVDLMVRSGATVVVDEEAKVGELLGKAAVQAAFDDVLDESA